MKNIVVIGAGDLGKEVIWLIEDINRIKPTYLILGFLDDDIGKKGGEFFGYRVLGTSDELDRICNIMPISAVVAIRDEKIRKRIVEEHPTFNSWETIIHPSAVVSASTSIGVGTIIFPLVSMSVDNVLGRFGLYYLNCSIGNDCRIGDFVSVMQRAVVPERSIIEDNKSIP